MQINDLLNRMAAAGFTQHERNNFRLRMACLHLLANGQCARIDDATMLEFGAMTPNSNRGDA